MTKTIDVFENVVKQCDKFWAQQALANAAALQIPEHKGQDAYSMIGNGALDDSKASHGDPNAKATFPIANAEQAQDKAKSDVKETNVVDVKTAKEATVVDSFL